MSAKGSSRAIEHVHVTTRAIEPGPAIRNIPGWGQQVFINSIDEPNANRAAMKAANEAAEEVIEEVLVKGKYVPAPTGGLITIGRLFGAMSVAWNALGAYFLGKELLAFAEAWNEEINIAVAAVDQEVAANLDAVLSPPDEFTVTQPMEHVYVTAPSLANPKVTIDAGLQTLPQVSPMALPVVAPDFFPSTTDMPDDYPVPMPKIEPVIVPPELPEISPSPQAVPDPFLWPGSLAVKASKRQPGIVIQLGPTPSTMPNPAIDSPIPPPPGPQKPPEENRLRKDRKSGSASAMMRAIYTMWGTTFGTATEILDLYEVLANSTYVWYRGGWARVSGVPNGWEILYNRLINGDRYHVDYERFLLSYYTMRVMDSVIGRLTGGTREYNRVYGNRMALIKYGLPQELQKEAERALGKDFAQLFDWVYYEYVNGNTPFHNTRYRRTGQRLTGVRRKWTRGRRSVLKHKRFSNRT